jgi:putative membrane protein
MMWWNHGGWGAGDWLAMSFMMVLFWGLLIALVVWLVRSTGEKSAPAPSLQRQTDRADELLAERFARGEIDEPEFNRSRTLLHTSSARS